MKKETSREKWVRRTRESTARALRDEGGLGSAASLEGNLDISWYATGLGFIDQRSEREISAALRWLVKQGYAERMTFRSPFDPPGVCYELTRHGYDWIEETQKAT